METHNRLVDMKLSGLYCLIHRELNSAKTLSDVNYFGLTVYIVD